MDSDLKFALKLPFLALKSPFKNVLLLTFSSGTNMESKSSNSLVSISKKKSLSLIRSLVSSETKFKEGKRTDNSFKISFKTVSY